MANEHIFKSGVIVTGSIESSTGFVGDGSQLTGVTSVTVWNGKLVGTAAITGSLIVSSSTSIVDFTNTAGATGSFTGSFKGDGTGLTNLNINNATGTGVNLSGSFSGNGSALTGLAAFPYYGDAKITGSLTVSSSLVDFSKATVISGSTFSGSFVGDGTGLSGLTASPAGTNHQVQYNISGVTGASNNFRFDSTTLYVSQSIQISTSGSGALRLTQDYNSPNISLLQARGSGGTNMGSFLFQGRTPYGTTSDYLTVSSAEVDAKLALIKGGRLSVGGYPATTPSAAQGNLYVKRTISSSFDTVATFENTNSEPYGGGGFIDIVGNSNDYASGGIRVKNGIYTDGEIYYSAASRSIILEANKRTGSSQGGLQFKWQSSTKFLVNAAGDVGIGTTTPSQKLDVQGKIVAKDKILINGSDFDMASLESTAGHKIARVDVQDGIYDYGNRAMYINSGSVGIGTASPDAILDISSTTDGVLLPRLTTTQISAISSPTTGLTVYNTTLNQLCFYNGTIWRRVSDSNMITLP
jgi:hypothetical protein